MKTKILLGVTALVLLAGCQKSDVGRAIRFSAVTRSDAGGTKAEYSGVVTTGKERINWTNGDKIQLRMTNTDETGVSRNYTVTTITPNGAKSSAKLVAEDPENQLEWATDGTHYFWAAFPSTASFGAGDTRTISGTISGTQEQTYSTTNSGVDMFETDQTMYLTAGKISLAAEIGDPISLDFDPAMTTFDFEVGSNTTDDIMIRGFELTTELAEGDVADANLRALSGNFTATYNASMDRSLTTTAATVSNRSITVNFDKQPAISQTKKVRFRVMALPQDIQGLTVIFNTTETNSAVLGETVDKQHKLRLKTSGGDWITFDGCGKADITGLLIPGAEWKITFSGPRVQQWTVYDEVVIGVE